MPGCCSFFRVFQSPGGENISVTISCFGAFASHVQVGGGPCFPALTVSPSAVLTCAAVTCVHGSLGTCAPTATRARSASNEREENDNDCDAIRLH